MVFKIKEERDTQFSRASPARREVMRVLTVALLALWILPAVRAYAQDPSAQAVFEKYNMLGTFAMNCAKPASKENLYVVRRPVDGGFVQTDVMNGPTERLSASVTDRAAGLGPGELSVSTNSDVHGRVNIVIRVEADRFRTLENTTADGKKHVVDGYQVNPRAPMPWFNKCHSAAVRAAFEKYNLLGTFAIDCRKPASKSNYYIVTRPLDGGGVQSDTMTGPKERAITHIIDRAATLGPSELSVTVSAEYLDYVYRVEGNRFRVVAGERQFGEKFIVDGRAVGGSGADLPWMSKCK